MGTECFGVDVFT